MFLPHRNEVFIMYQALFIKTLRLSRHCGSHPQESKWGIRVFSCCGVYQWFLCG